MPTALNIARGALAGLAGAAAMHLVRVGWEKAFPCPPDGIFGFDWEADVRSVNLLWSKFTERTLPDEQAERIALQLHYAFGLLSGAAYSAAAEKVPSLSTGQGTLFGFALWLLAGELAIAASGISHPRDKSLKSHVSSAAVHLLFGTIVETARAKPAI